MRIVCVGRTYLTFESGRRSTVWAVPQMRISQLAERSGVPATTLRFYETAGLLPADGLPPATASTIRRRWSGWRSSEPRSTWACPWRRSPTCLGSGRRGACADVKADLRPRVAARLDEAEHRIAELSAFTTALTGALEHLDALPDRSGPCDPRCGFLDTHRSAVAPVAVNLLPYRRAAEGERWRTAPVACSLDADGLGERAGRRQDLVQGAVRTAIAQGLRLTLPADRAAAMAELAAAEQECCPFFDFRLHLDGRDLHLEVRAPSEGADLLADLFGPSA